MLISNKAPYNVLKELGVYVPKKNIHIAYDKDELKAMFTEFPTQTVILQYDNVYKDDFSVLSKVINNYREVYIRIGEGHIAFKEGKKKSIDYGNEQKLIGIVESMALNEINLIHKQFKESYGDPKPFLANYNRLAPIVERLFEHIDAHEELAYDIMRKPHVTDIYLFKLMYLLHLKSSNDTAYLRKLPKEYIDEAFDIQALLDKFLKMKVEIEAILNDEEPMDEYHINLMEALMDNAYEVS